MSARLEYLKQIKTDARKAKDSSITIMINNEPTDIEARLIVAAIDAIIVNIDIQRHDNIEITDSVVLNAIKKESRIYHEAMSMDKKYLEECDLKAKYLESLLPEQLTEAQLRDKFTLFLGELSDTEKPTPKGFMNYLNFSLFLEGRYDKSDAAKIVMEFNKNGR